MIQERNNLSNTHHKINKIINNHIDNTKTHLLIVINNRNQIKIIPITFNHQLLIY
jgi:hypothetical protein